MRALIEQRGERYAVSYATTLFSRRSGDAFLDYLKNIEATADPQILEDVRGVYGDDWPTPFLAMYEVERKMRRRDR